MYNNRPVPHNKNDFLIKQQKTWSAAQHHLQTTKQELGTPGSLRPVIT
jgi:hypothetical protein